MEIEISENVQYIIKELIRFLKKENLWNQFKIDFNPWAKIQRVGLSELLYRLYNCKYDDKISLQELVQLRCNDDCGGGEELTLKAVLDRVLVYRQCKYNNWNLIDIKWRRYFSEKLSPKMVFLRKRAYL